MEMLEELVKQARRETDTEELAKKVDGMRRVLDELVHEQQLVENLERTDFRADDEPGTSKSKT